MEGEGGDDLLGGLGLWPWAALCISFYTKAFHRNHAPFVNQLKLFVIGLKLGVSQALHCTQSTKSYALVWVEGRDVWYYWMPTKRVGGTNNR